ncbi:hypothetical protein [uncultured Arcticibacterium sp.]|uniref:hypothetical protein n=1 Tax=uncultured Arcticibacterium sp. TaxID=2173042 RepID=UPI0030FB5AD6
MRKIILLSSAFLLSIGLGFGQSIELTPDGYDGNHSTGNQIEIKTNAIPIVNMFRHSGTISSPGATPANFTIGRFWGGGHSGEGFVEGTSRIDFRTTGSAFTSKNFGSFMRFYTTAEGTTTASERMRITDIGDVGIGTAAPEEKLHVKGGDFLLEDTTPFFELRNTGDAGANGITFANSTGQTRAQIKYTPLDSQKGVIQMLEGSGSNNGLFFIDGPGTANSGNNLGINEDEPRARLHIRSNSQPTNPSLLIEENNNGSVDAITFENFSSSEKWHIKYQSNDTDANANFRINASNTGDVATFTGDGNTKLHGYTQLGDSAPKIKMKRLTGTTASTEGTTSYIAHGLGANRILAVDVHVNYATNTYVPENHLEHSNYQFSYIHDNVNIRIYTKAGNSANILSKPVVVLVTYEE